MKKDKLHIHWYPGHIAKAEKKLKEQLSLVDAVIEVIDELNKFVKVLEKKYGFPVLKSDAKNFRDLNVVVKKVVELSEPRIQALMKKGLLRRPARVMVVGMPNVGISSIINKLT